MAVHNIPPVQKSNHAWEIFKRSSSVQLPALGLRIPGNWSNTQRTSKGANPTQQSTNSVAIWVGFVSFKLVHTSYLDMKLRCKKQSQFLSLLLLLSHSLACLTSHFLLCATFHNFEQLGFCISSLHGELWQLEQGDLNHASSVHRWMKWDITFGTESSELVPLEQRRTQESKVTGSD